MHEVTSVRGRRRLALARADDVLARYTAWQRDLVSSRLSLPSSGAGRPRCPGTSHDRCQPHPAGSRDER